MKKLILCFVLFSPVLSLAQDMDASTAIVVAAPAPVVTAQPMLPAAADAGVSNPSAVVLDSPAPIAKVMFQSAANGNWWAAVSAFLVLVVALIRKYGKAIHEMLPDTNPLDKIFWFLFDTKPGGWLLNFLTAVAGVAGLAIMAGEQVTWTLMKPILIVALTSASLWEMAKDVLAWVASKKQQTPVPVAVPGAPAAPVAPTVIPAPAAPVAPAAPTSPPAP